MKTGSQSHENVTFFVRRGFDFEKRKVFTLKETDYFELMDKLRPKKPAVAQLVRSPKLTMSTISSPASKSTFSTLPSHHTYSLRRRVRAKTVETLSVAEQARERSSILEINTAAFTGFFSSFKLESCCIFLVDLAFPCSPIHFRVERPSSQTSTSSCSVTFKMARAAVFTSQACPGPERPQLSDRSSPICRRRRRWVTCLSSSLLKSTE